MSYYVCYGILWVAQTTVVHENVNAWEPMGASTASSVSAIKVFDCPFAQNTNVLPRIIFSAESGNKSY
jgi:hypothetical protein